MNFRTALAGLVFSFLVGFLVCFFAVKKKSVEIPQPEKILLSSLDLKLPEFKPKTLHPFRTYLFVPAGKDTVTRIDTIRVPVHYPHNYWLTRPDPISQRGNTLRFRYYDPAVGAEKINEYHLRPNAFQWGIYAEMYQPLDLYFSAMRSWEPTFGLRADMSYKRVGLFAGADFTPSTRDVMAVGGISVKIAGN